MDLFLFSRFVLAMVRFYGTFEQTSRFGVTPRRRAIPAPFEGLALITATNFEIVERFFPADSLEVVHGTHDDRYFVTGGS